jgi:hypothetical protein
MGSEIKCRVRFAKQTSEGKALLETNEIIFRGDFRLKIPFRDVQSAEVTGDELQLRTAEGVAKFELGTGLAEKWKEKILHPKSRIDKLGVKAHAQVALIGFDDEAEDDDFLQEISERTKNISNSRAGAVKTEAECIFLKAETHSDLARLSKISKTMRGATALWIVFPKGKPKGPQNITERDVFSVGRAAGLKDIKVVGFSATHTALKFVIPVSKR